jgi:5-enolpyruvylshikimate-3-phosphate synthase
MAAAVAKIAGAPLQISHPEVVNKSFPEFWEIYAQGKNFEFHSV